VWFGLRLGLGLRRWVLARSRHSHVRSRLILSHDGHHLQDLLPGRAITVLNVLGGELKEPANVQLVLVFVGGVEFVEATLSSFRAILVDHLADFRRQEWLGGFLPLDTSREHEPSC